MKRFIFPLLTAGISFFYIACNEVDNNPVDTNAEYQMNKIVATLNGRDTVMDIGLVSIRNVPRNENSPAHQLLSVISDAPGIGRQIVFCVSDTLISTEKLYYVMDPMKAMDLGCCTAYIHNYGTVPQISPACDAAAEYCCKITVLQGGTIMGEVKYKAEDVVVTAKFYSDQLQLE